MIEKKSQPTELERLQEWARVGLALHVACNAVIAMRYPEAVVAAALSAAIGEDIGGGRG